MEINATGKGGQGVTQAGFSQTLGITFEEHHAGTSRCSLKMRESFLNPNGVVHGGVIYTIVDTGMGLALWTLLRPEELCSTIEIKINYLRPVVAGRLIAESRVVQRGSTVAVLESRVEDEAGKLVALATGSFHLAPKRNAESTTA